MGWESIKVLKYVPLGPVKLRERRAWQGFAMLMVAQERQQGDAEMSEVTFLLGSDEMHVGGGADAAASRMRIQ
jgi:hypothetical protein